MSSDRDIRRTARGFPLAVLLWAIGQSPAAASANLQVAPLRLMFEPEQRAISVTLSNADDKPVVVEVKAFLWEQVDGQDKLTPTSDLVLTPPLAEVPGKGVRVIRVGRRATLKAGPVERTYRVFVQEVVPAAEAARPGLHFALRLSLPVFIAPKLDDELARPRVAWSIAAGPKGEFVVTARNTGTARVQVIGLELLGADDSVRAKHSQMTYVLAGQSRRFLLAPLGALPAPGSQLTIKAMTDAGDQVARVAFAAP